MALLSDQDPDTLPADGRRRLWRRLTIGAASVAIAAVLLVAAVHTPFVRARALSWALARLQADLGVRAEAGRLDYNLLAMRVGLTDVTLSAEDSDAPFLQAKAIRLDLPWSIVRGGLSVQSLEIDEPRVTIVTRADGTSNLPATGSTTPAESPSSPLGPIDIGRLAVRDLELHYADEAQALAVDGGKLTLDLRRGNGPLLDGALTLSDELSIRLGDRRTTVSELGGRVSFDGTAVTVADLIIRAPEANLQLDGTVDVLADELRADLQYQGGLDLGRLAPWLALEPAPGGVVTLSGRLDGLLTDPRGTINADGRVTWSTLRDMSLQIAATISGAEANVESFRASLAGGSLTGDARVPLDASGAGRANLRWQGLDVAAIASAASAALPLRLGAVAGGTAAFEWTGRDVASARGSLEAVLRRPPAPNGALTIAGNTALALDNGRWRLSLDNRLGDAIGVRADARGQLDPANLAASTLGGNVALRVTDLGDVAREVSAAGYPMNADAVRTLHATLAADAVLTGTFESPRGAGTIDASDLRYDDIGPATAHANFDGTASRVSLDAIRLELGRNVISASAVVDVERNTLAGELNADLAQIDRLAATVPAEWRPEGSARVDARFTGALDNPTVTASLSSDDLGAAGQRFRQLQATARLENQTLTVDALELAQDERRLTASGRYAIPSGRYTFEVTGHNLVVVPVPPADTAASDTSTSATPGAAAAEAIPIDARFDLGASGEGSVSSPQATGFAQFSRLEWDGRDLGAARLDFVVEAGAARVHAGIPRLSATVDSVVTLDQPYEFTATASVLNAQLRQLIDTALGSAASPEGEGFPTERLAGALTAQVKAAGNFAAVAESTVGLELSLADVTANDAAIRLDRPARLRYADGQVFADDFALRVGATTLTAVGGIGGTAPAGDGLRATLAGSLADLVPLARLVPALSDFDAAGAVALEVRASGPLDAPDVGGRFSLDSASFSAGTVPPASDVGVNATYAGGLLELRDLRAHWQGATLSGSAQVPAPVLGDLLPAAYLNTLPDLPDRARATLRLESVTQEALAPFMDDPAALDEIVGRFDLTAAVDAGSLDLADVVADVAFERAELELARVPIRQAQPTRLRLADGRLDVVAWNWEGEGTRVDIAGGADLTGETPQLDLGVTGRLDLRLLGAFSRDVVTGGLATLDVKVSGEASAPAIAGQVAISDGDVIMRDPRIAVTGLQGFIDLTRDRLAIRDMTASANGGTVSVSGEVQYPGFKPTAGTIAITGRGLAFEIPDGLRTEVDADLQLGVSDTAPSLTGTVTVLRGYYRQPLSLAGQLLTGVEVRSATPEAAPAEPSLLSRTRLGIGVVSAQDIVVDNNYGRLEIGSNLRITGTLAQPALSGRLMFQEGGEVFLGGRTYRVRRGTVDFTDATRIEPNISLALDTRVQRYDITLEVSGTPETIEATLRSPGASTADAISLLLTGQLADDASVAQTEIASGQLLMLLSGELLGFAGRAVGLDSVQVSRGYGGAASDFDLLATDTDPSARLTIGKNLSRDVEIVFSQNLRESGDVTWIAIYQPLRNIELRGTTQDDGSRSYEFRHDVDFGSGRVARPPAAAQAPPVHVEAVQITGTPGFAERELRDLLKVKAGDRFDFIRWQDDRERLERFYHERDLLEARISARREDAAGRDGSPAVTLQYAIERGPRTELVIDGYQLSSGLIDDMRTAWGRAVFDGFLTEDLETMATRQLVDDGYLQAEVKSEVSRSADGVKQIALHIAPGTHFDERRINFTGQQQVPTDALDDVVRLADLEDAAWLDPARLKDALERHYRSLGFTAVSVRVDAPRFAGRTATLPVSISEGRPFEVARVDVVGTSARTEADVRQQFGIAAGSRYVPSTLQPARRAVELEYLRDGYNDVRVSVTTLVDEENASVNVQLRVEEGRQQVLSGIDVSGARRTADSVVERALDLEPGTPANLTDYYRAQKRLYDTGVFRLADVEVDPVGEAEAGATQPVRAKVTLEELSPYRFRYGFRVADRVGPAEATRQIQPALVADLLRRNLFGRAVTTGVAGQLEADRRLARGILTLPTFFTLPVTTSFFLTGSRETFAPESATPFVEDQTAFTAEQRLRPADRMAVTYGYTLTRSHTFAPNPVPGIPVLDLVARIARLTGTYAWDTRDDPANPRSGWFRSSGLELGTASLGSDLRFIRYLGQQYYFRRAGSTILASAVRVGAGRGFGQDLIPSEKFFAGGGTSVRGFAEDGLGEVDFFGDPRGGNGLLLFNQEMRFPIFKWARGVSFFDAGNVFTRASDLSLRRLEAGTGVGLRIDSPFALVRIDYGMPLTRRDREPFGRWYFAIGHTF